MENFQIIPVILPVGKWQEWLFLAGERVKDKGLSLGCPWKTMKSTLPFYYWLLATLDPDSKDIALKGIRVWDYNGFPDGSFDLIRMLQEQKPVLL